MENKITGVEPEVIETEDTVNGDEEVVSADEEIGNSANSGGEHHHHHHHHHRRRSHKKKKKVGLDNRVVLIISIVLFVILAAVVVTFEMVDVYKPGDNGEAKDNTTLVVEVLNPEGILVKEDVVKYLEIDLLNSYNSTIKLSDMSETSGRLDVQVPVALKISTQNGTATTYKVEVANNDGFIDAVVRFIDEASPIYKLEHLYSNTEYYYRVTAYTSNGIEVSSGSFKTSDTPRILSIEGLSNVRDIGNWKTDSGKRIKQGLLIRGTEMDGAVEKDYHLTNTGLVDMLDEFGIKTDMDLRAQSAITKDALGSRVEHSYYNMVMYENIFTDEGKDRVKAFFADLADLDNYPIYLHCTYGCDRTGTVCYLLEAMLGVSKGDCLRDYGLSNLHIDRIRDVETGLQQYEGNTLKEQAESYLLSCGVSEHQIESIRNIFLGD